MPKLSCLFIIALASILFVTLGCKEEAAPGRVALLDLQLVGNEIGAFDRIERELASDRMQLSQLERSLGLMQREISSFQGNKEAKDGMVKEYLVLQRTFSQKREAFNKRAADLSGSFRQLVHGYAEKIASQDGYTIVLNFNSRSPNERVMVWDNKANLTESVIKAMQADGYQRPKQPARPAGPQAPLTVPPAGPRGNQSRVTPQTGPVAPSNIPSVPVTPVKPQKVPDAGSKTSESGANSQQTVAPSTPNSQSVPAASQPKEAETPKGE